MAVARRQEQQQSQLFQTHRLNEHPAPAPSVPQCLRMSAVGDWPVFLGTRLLLIPESEQKEGGRAGVLRYGAC